MKKVTILLLVLFGFTAVTVVSCKKAQEASPVVVKTDQTATIEGKVWAELDWTEAGMEEAPSGTTIFFQIEKQDLNPQAPGGEYLLYSTTIGSGGEYSISVPTNTNGVTVTIIPNDFVYDVETGGDDLRTVFSAGPMNVTVVYGETEIKDFSY